MSGLNKYNLNKLFVLGCEKDLKGIEVSFELELMCAEGGAGAGIWSHHSRKFLI